MSVALLHGVLGERVAGWRAAGYPVEAYPALAEVLEWATDPASVRETLTLGYPSYILALAMGAGKTTLIGAVYATEFALALEYPEAPFVRNALVFAPGKTILESLRELASMPYDRLLPPRLFKPFAASMKLTFTRDGEKDIPVVHGSLYNVVVTNTEKIRIQKAAVRKGDLGGLFGRGREDEARAEVANLRLQAIASLPDLAVFSDEAPERARWDLVSEWLQAAEDTWAVARSILGLDLHTAWVAEWNQFRRGKTAMNRLEVIELRTDPKYGKFFQHQPARAKVRLTRKGGTVTVTIEEFVSPSIVERLGSRGGCSSRGSTTGGPWSTAS